MTTAPRRVACAVAAFMGVAAGSAGGRMAGPSGAGVLPSDADIRRIIAERVELLAGPQNGIGMVVGVVGPEGRRVVAYGHRSQSDRRPLDGATVFEIGSVGKVFTALLLADMVTRGEAALTDPVARLLPAGARIPERNGRPITLLDLATHTSGLPFMPDAYPVFNDPAAPKVGVGQLYQFLARYHLTRDPGTEWDYSNIGYWLLGQALASRGGMEFESLLRTRVIGPLRLQRTAVSVSPRLIGNLAVGHNAVLQPAPPFDAVSIYSSMGPAIGALVSTADDLLTLLSAAMGYERSPLAPSMAAMLNARRPMGAGTAQALGWVVTGTGNDQVITHEGGSWGYVSYVAWDPARRAGVVVLSNQQSGVGDIARHLLRPDVPLEKPVVTRHVEVALDSAALDACAGQYDAEDEGRVTIIRERDFLTLQLPIGWGLPALRLRPSSPSEFFVAELPVRVTTQTDGAGRVIALQVYPPRGQRAIPARRVGGVK